MLAELLGTGLLVAVVVGSGIAAERLSPGDVGLQLLQNSVATTLGLAVLIVMFGPVSGAHFNPVVSVADWFLGRRAGTGLTVGDLGAYIAAQTVGGIAGAVLANAMFEVRTSISTKERLSGGPFLGEVVATTFLVALIFSLARSHRGALAGPAVGAYIGAAYWFTSSTSFANPAVTVGRVFSDTFAGIAPGSAPGFVAAQLVGLAVGVALTLALYPDIGEHADDVLMSHPDEPADERAVADTDAEGHEVDGLAKDSFTRDGTRQ
ncbi:MAG: MIP/aquaporin family protein [Ornithinimicrobium sp.]